MGNPLAQIRRFLGLSRKKTRNPMLEPEDAR